MLSLCFSKALNRTVKCRFSLLAGVLVLHLSVLTCNAQSNEKDLTRLMAHAQEAFEQNEYEKSADLYGQLIDIYLTIDSLALSPEMSTAIMRRANCLSAIGESEEAEALYLRADSTFIYQDISGTPRAMNLFLLGHFYMNKGRYLEAEEVLLKSLELRKEEFGDYHQYVSTGYEALWYLYTLQGQWYKGAVYASEWLLTETESFGLADSSTAQAVFALAECHIMNKDFAEAESLLVLTITYNLDKDQRDYKSLGRLYTMLGHTFLEQERYSESLEAQWDALAAAEEGWGRNHFKVFMPMSRLAQSLFESGHMAKADSFFALIIDIAENPANNFEPYDDNRLRMIAEYLRELGRIEEAERLEQVAQSIEPVTIR